MQSFQLLLLVLRAGFCAVLGIDGAHAQTHAPEKLILAQNNTLTDLSLEELSNIEITSVAKRPQRLSEAASSIYVITQQDIHRSGAHNIADALRLAPNLQVARVGANQMAISARGFNSTSANKLLVLIDGRSVYTPLYSGVFWDVQDMVMEDIDRIEVISGPGATLWGSNAVNGIINVITRDAHATEKSLATIDIGTEGKSAALRYGAKLSDTASYRAYSKVSDYNASVDANAHKLKDAWRLVQGGFRLDATDAYHSLTVQADAYTGASEQPASNILNNFDNLDKRSLGGGNVSARWTRYLDNGSQVQVLGYLDHTKRIYPGTFGESLDTINLEAQHRFRPNQKHDVVWGAGYRYANDRVQNSALLAFLPAERSLRNFNLFAQDEINLVADKLDMSLGIKFEHNEYSGLEIQPSARLAWKVSDKQNLWAAISKAARAPSRIDTEFFLPADPPFAIAGGGPNFTSETVVAYELGYRGKLSANTTLSATGFYNVYRRLRNLEPNSSGTLILSNRMQGESSGVELWAETRPLEKWRLQLGCVTLHKHLRLPENSTDPYGTAAAGNDPPYQISLRSSADLANGIEWDVGLRRVGQLLSPRVPAYTGLDTRLAWSPNRHWEIALLARDLLKSKHLEFLSDTAPSMVSRSLFLKATWTSF